MRHGYTGEVIHADDTLLRNNTGASVELSLKAVQRPGANFALSLHSDNFQLLNVHCKDTFRRADGTTIAKSDGILYLGSLSNADGCNEKELTRRFGEPHAEFRALARVRKHSNLTRAKKLQVFNAIVISKMIYALATSCLNVAGKRRLNCFQGRCLLQIWGIQPAFIFRIANIRVPEVAEQQPLALIISKQLLKLYGKEAKAPTGSLMRDPCSIANSPRPRRRGTSGKLADPEKNGNSNCTKSR